MYFRKLAALIAASTLAAAGPAIAAQSLSPATYVQDARAGADMEDSNSLAGGSGGLWAAAIGIALLAAVVVVLLDDDEDEDLPVSP